MLQPILFSSVLLYRSPNSCLQDFLDSLQSFLFYFKIDVILGDFNIDFFDINRQLRLTNILIEYTQIVDQPSHIDGALLDHVYVRTSLLQKYKLNHTVSVAITQIMREYLLHYINKMDFEIFF